MSWTPGCTIDCESMPECGRCGQKKAPCGRLTERKDLCTNGNCPGYWETPLAGHLWPGESGHEPWEQIPGEQIRYHGQLLEKGSTAYRIAEESVRRRDQLARQAEILAHNIEARKLCEEYLRTENEELYRKYRAQRGVIFQEDGT